MSRYFDLFEGLRPAQRRWSAAEGSGRTVFRQTGASPGGIERAVAQLYLAPAAPAPRVLAFLQSGRETRSRLVCARAADLLASRAATPVCLVEADPAGPSLYAGPRVAEKLGLAELLSDAGAAVNAAVVQMPDSHLWLLEAGSGARGADGFRSPLLAERIRQLRQRFGFVLIDAPPDSNGSGALALARVADAAVLVIETGARRERVVRWKESIEAAGVKLLGVILIDDSFAITGEAARGQ